MPTDAIRNDNDDSIFEEILKRSATDQDYRARLIANPAGAIEEVVGVPVSSFPRPINVKFVEKDAGLDALIVLPDFLNQDALSDAEMEAVAGGLGNTCQISCVCTDCCITSM